MIDEIKAFIAYLTNYKEYTQQLHRKETQAEISGYYRGHTHGFRLGYEKGLQDARGVK